jgi:hypothetical protein
MPIQWRELFSSFDVGLASTLRNRAARGTTRPNPTNDPGGDPNIRHHQTTAAKQQ